MSIVHIHHISFSLCLSTAVCPLPLRLLRRWLVPTATTATLRLHSSSTAAPPLRLYSYTRFPVVSHGRCTPPVVTSQYRSSSLQYSAARCRCSRTLVSDAYTTPNESQKQQQIPHREEGVKEKIILSQEKSIQRLTELVRDLKE
ncbi:hypothetical protein ACS0TY_024291 [Phlomoides rotata]